MTFKYGLSLVMRMLSCSKLLLMLYISNSCIFQQANNGSNQKTIPKRIQHSDELDLVSPCFRFPILGTILDI